MKEKISICMDKKVVNSIEREVAKGLFRNRSHIIEVAINDFLKKIGADKNEH